MNIQDEVQKIHHQYGTSEMANYEIQKLFDKQQKRSYSEEEVFNLLMEFSSRDINSSSRTPHSVANWFEQFKKK
jgi:hypothetical protein